MTYNADKVREILERFHEVREAGKLTRAKFIAFHIEVSEALGDGVEAEGISSVENWAKSNEWIDAAGRAADTKKMEREMAIAGTRASGICNAAVRAWRAGELTPEGCEAVRVELQSFLTGPQLTAWTGVLDGLMSGHDDAEARALRASGIGYRAWCETHRRDMTPARKLELQAQLSSFLVGDQLANSLRHLDEMVAYAAQQIADGHRGSDRPMFDPEKWRAVTVRYCAAFDAGELTKNLFVVLYVELTDALGSGVEQEGIEDLVNLGRSLAGDDSWIRAGEKAVDAARRRARRAARKASGTPLGARPRVRRT